MYDVAVHVYDIIVHMYDITVHVYEIMVHTYSVLVYLYRATVHAFYGFVWMNDLKKMEDIVKNDMIYTVNTAALESMRSLCIAMTGGR